MIAKRVGWHWADMADTGLILQTQGRYQPYAGPTLSATVKSHCKPVQCHIEWKQCSNDEKKSVTLNSQYTPHSSPMRVSYGEYSVSIWTKMDKVLMRLDHINGLVQDCSNSSALAMELLQSYTKPCIYGKAVWIICTPAPTPIPSGGNPSKEYQANHGYYLETTRCCHC